MRPPQLRPPLNDEAAQQPEVPGNVRAIRLLDEDLRIGSFLPVLVEMVKQIGRHIADRRVGFDVDEDSAGILRVVGLSSQR